MPFVKCNSVEFQRIKVKKKTSFIRQTYITMYLFLIKPTIVLENIRIINNVSLV